MKRALRKTLLLLTGKKELLIPKLFRTRPTYRQLIQKESEIGGTLFGSIPAGHHRQFFNLDTNTWVWYEEWLDGKGKKQSTTTRYEVHENGILKIQDKTPYYFLEGTELVNFMSSVKLYYEKVSREVYRRDPATGHILAVQ